MKSERKILLKITGMTCPSCAAHVQRALNGVPGVLEARVPGWESGRAEVLAREGLDVRALIEAVRSAGYDASLESETSGGGPVRPSSGSSSEPALMVIGAGSAGFAAAIRAAELGYKALLVEAGTIGGTCVNVGCVPSKTLIRALGTYHHAAANPFRGINTAAGRISWPEVIAQKNELVAQLRKSKYVDVLEAYPEIEYLEGRARFVSENRVEVDGRTFEPERVVIATGASPWAPPIPGLDEVGYLTSATAMDLRELPSSLAVLGGNAAGLELAQVFARAGSAVTVVELLDRIAPMEEPEISRALEANLRDEGIRILTAARTREVSRRHGRVLLEIDLQDGDSVQVEAEQLLVAAGRRPNTQGLGLEEAGIEVNERGAVVVDAQLRTTHPNVYAAGDVTGRDMFVYVAAYCGGLAAENALTGAARSFEPVAIPRVTFTDPQIASVGLTEQQARERGYAVKATTFPLEHLPKALVARDTRGLIKLVADVDTDRLLGTHILAPEAGEVIQIATLAIKFGITVHELIDTLFPYLTLAEGIKLAAQTFEKDVTKLSCCAG